MLSKIKKIGWKVLFRLCVLAVLSFRMFSHLFYITEMEFQIYRDMELYKAMILFLIILAIYRGISLKDWKAWLFVLLSACILPFYFNIKNISPETYGPVYFEFTVCRGIMQLIFVGLLADLIRHKPYKMETYFKNPVVILYLLFVTVFVVTNKESIIPYFCPVFASLFTRFDDKDRTEISYLFSISAYCVFVKCFTMSLIQNPNNYFGGRYYGSFLNIGSAGASCSIALLACIYMVIVCKRKNSRIGIIGCMLLAIYPIIAILMMESRSVTLGVILMVLGIWVFLHGKGMKTTYKRFAMSVLAFMCLPIILFGMSKILVFLTNSGKVDSSKLDYFWGHVLLMSTTEYMEDTIFEPGTFLFALDALASTRVSIWVDKFSHIRLTGFNEYSRVGYNSHNFFIANLVRYGYLGGLPFVGWFFSCLFCFAKKVRENSYSVFAVFLFLLMLGNFSAQSLYITSMGGYLLLFIQVFTISSEEKKEA